MGLVDTEGTKRQCRKLSAVNHHRQQQMLGPNLTMLQLACVLLRADDHLPRLLSEPLKHLEQHPTTSRTCQRANTARRAAISSTAAPGSRSKRQRAANNEPASSRLVGVREVAQDSGDSPSLSW
jgi:hypothetical protein